MRIAQVHLLFEEWGGGETLALRLYNAMTELGHDVDLYTTYVDPGVRQFMPANVKVNLIKVRWQTLLRKLTRGRFVRLRRLMNANAALNKTEDLQKSYDLVIETQSNMLYLGAHVSYIHFPATIDLQSHKRAPWWKAYDWYVARLVKRMEQASKSRGLPLLVLTNSSWTEQYVYKAYGVHANILYPPVDYEFFHSYASDRRENIVVTVSRYTPEKHLEYLPIIASKVPEAQFYLVGSLSKYSGPVVSKINENKDAYGAHNFHMLFNVKREKIAELLGKAKVYLHPPFAEHFGIAIAEAMAAGAVPVVYRDGGGWYDIVARLDKSLGYRSIGEAIGVIKAVLSEPQSQLAEESKRAMSVASTFRYENFRAAAQNYLLKAYRLKTEKV